MGEVYRARDTKLNRDVAIKVLLPAVANDPDRLARFSREAQVLASLNHPNIAAIYGLEEVPADVASGARLEIDDALTPLSEGATMSSLVVHTDLRSRGRLRVAWSVAALFAVLAAALAIAMSLRPALPEAPVFRSTLLVGESLSERSPSNRFALSPDGRLLAYVAAVSAGSVRVSLWIRALDGSGGKELVGTEGATAPFWSPDSRFIAFTVGGKLKKIAATGGTPINIADAPLEGDGRGSPGTWNSDDVIVLPAPDFASLVRVPAAGVSGGGASRLIWSDRTGKQTVALNDRAPYRDLWLSPDGTQASVSLFDESIGQSDIWIVDVIRGLRTRFTFDSADEYSGVWSPDGVDIVFNSRRKGRLDLYRKAASGSGGEDLVLADPFDKTPTHWSPDGQFILYNVSATNTQTGNDVWVLPLSGARKPFPFAATAFDERWAQFSPDGRWVAYASNENGRTEVYVAPFPGPGAKRQVSDAAGNYPRWRRDGKELIYWNLDGQLMAATLRRDAARLEVEAVRPLFETRSPGGGVRSFFDASRDGQRFLHSVAAEQAAAIPITLVTNWPALLKTKARP